MVLVWWLLATFCGSRAQTRLTGEWTLSWKYSQVPSLPSIFYIMKILSLSDYFVIFDLDKYLKTSRHISVRIIIKMCLYTILWMCFSPHNGQSRCTMFNRPQTGYLYLKIQIQSYICQNNFPMWTFLPSFSPFNHKSFHGNHWWYIFPGLPEWLVAYSGFIDVPWC